MKLIDLQAVKTSLNMWMKSLQETLADIRNHVHEELGLVAGQRTDSESSNRIIQKRMEARIEANHREFQTKLKELEAGAERGRGTGTSVGAAKPPKFDWTISWPCSGTSFRPQQSTNAGQTWRNPHI
jgi:hypothetical protein